MMGRNGAVNGSASQGIPQRLFGWLSAAFQACGEAIRAAVAFINGLHPLLRIAIWLILILGCLGVVLSLITAIRKHWRTRLANNTENLNYSYFSGTRSKLIRVVRHEYFSLLFSNLWNKACLYYWVHQFGEIVLNSRILGVIASVPYFAFGIAAILEFAVKIVFGILLAVVLIPAEIILYAVLKIIVLVLRPIVAAISQSQLKTQHCMDCYAEIKKPIMQCPECGTEHSYIRPGKYGLFYARCTCGKAIRILPKYQQIYEFRCPNCGTELISNRVRQSYVAVLACAGSMESTFIREMRIQYEAATIGIAKDVCHVGSQNILALTDPQRTSATIDPTDAEELALYYRHKRGHLFDSLVLCAVPALCIRNDAFAKAPVFLEQLDGINVVMDLSENTGAQQQADREMTEIVSQFIQQFSAMTGRRASRLSPVNLAVTVVADASLSRGSAGGDTSAFCRDLLQKKGYGAAIAQLESVFKNVRFFTVNRKASGLLFDRAYTAQLLSWLMAGQDNTVCELLTKQ